MYVGRPNNYQSKIYLHICASMTKQYNFLRAKQRLHCVAGKVTVGLAGIALTMCHRLNGISICSWPKEGRTPCLHNLAVTSAAAVILEVRQTKLTKLAFSARYNIFVLAYLRPWWPGYGMFYRDLSVWVGVVTTPNVHNQNQSYNIPFHVLHNLRIQNTMNVCITKYTHASGLKSCLDKTLAKP